MSKKKIVLKIGGALNVLNGVPNLPFIENIVQQIAKLVNDFHFILVLSGAIPIGVSVSQDKIIDLSPENKALYSMMGQSNLFETYIITFRKYGIKAGSGNYTTNTLKNNFTKKVFQRALDKNFVILSNEADNVNPEEINGDNDLLANEIALIIQADCLLLLTIIDNGITCNLPSQLGLDCQQGIIKTIKADLLTDKFLKKIDTGTKSRKNTNGIQIKLKAAKMAGSHGIKTVIASGQQKDIILDILQGGKQGTTIIP